MAASQRLGGGGRRAGAVVLLLLFCCFKFSGVEGGVMDGGREGRAVSNLKQLLLHYLRVPTIVDGFLGAD